MRLKKMSPELGTDLVFGTSAHGSHATSSSSQAERYVTRGIKHAANFYTSGSSDDEEDEDYVGESDESDENPSRKRALLANEQNLRNTLERIEDDEDMCPKMRWYVARYLRQEYQEDLSPSRQKFLRRVNEGHEFRKTSEGRDKLIALKRSMNRLDFEATRAHAGFYKDQPGWEARPITRILQAAYTQYGWSEIITRANVDTILLEAGADPALYDKTSRSAVSRHVTPPPTPDQGALEIIDIESSPDVKPRLEVLARRLDGDRANGSPRRSHTKSGGVAKEKARPRIDSNEGDGEMIVLRAEIRELKAQAEREKLFKETLKASQEALLTEVRLMREAVQGDKKRKRCDKKRLKRRRLRKCLRRLKELESEGGISSSDDETSSSSE